MILYRYLTGPDDKSFCHRITAALNGGWQLWGQPTLAFDSEKKRMTCGQVIMKEVPGETYNSSTDLSKY